MSEAGIASGVRRIEAVVGPAAVQYLNQVDGIVRALASQLKIKSDEIPSRVAGAEYASPNTVSVLGQFSALKALQDPSSQPTRMLFWQKVFDNSHLATLLCFAMCHCCMRCCSPATALPLQSTGALCGKSHWL